MENDASRCGGVGIEFDALEADLSEQLRELDRLKD